MDDLNDVFVKPEKRSSLSDETEIISLLTPRNKLFDKLQGNNNRSHLDEKSSKRRTVENDWNERKTNR